MFLKQKKAFTLVELIVVITILAILGTIAFISLQGYSKSARDSRRISDVNNVKTSLELFIVNVGKYPLLDNGEEVLYSGGLLWTQGIVGDVVTRNLSKNLPKKPVDPLTETEYIYSVANNNKEFEVLGFYEGITVYNNILNTVNAASNYTPKISGTYNGVFLKTSTTIVPTPSIINAEIESGGLTLDATNIQSQIISGGENFPDINNQLSIGNLDINLSTAAVIKDDSSDDAKLLAIEAIQATYSGTSLASDYEYILSKTEDDDKLDLVENVILNKSNGNGVKENIISSNWSGDGTASGAYVFKNNSGVNIYPITCNEILIGSTYEPNGLNGIGFLDGFYKIDPDGELEGGNGEFDIFCDMNGDGGGWMLAYNYSQADGWISQLRNDPLKLEQYIGDNLINLIVKDEIITTSREYKRFIKNTSLKGTNYFGNVRFGQAKLKWTDDWEGDDRGNDENLNQHLFSYTHTQAKDSGCTTATNWKCSVVNELHRTILADDGNKYISQGGTYYSPYNIYGGGLRITTGVTSIGSSKTHQFTTKGPEGSTRYDYQDKMNGILYIKKRIK